MLVFFGVFLGVYAWRRSTLPTAPRPQAPFPGAQLPPGQLQPGSDVSARLIRGGLLVDGDLADPLQDIELVRIGPAGAADAKVAFSGGWTSPVRAIWFFEVDDAAKYRIKIRTRLRSMTEMLTRGKVEPLELQRVRLHVKTGGSGVPVLAAFSADGNWLAMASNAGDVKVVSTPGDQTRIDVHVPDAVSQLSFSDDGKTLFVSSAKDRSVTQYSLETGRISDGGLQPIPNMRFDFKQGERAKSDDDRWLVKDGTASGSTVLYDTRVKPDESPRPLYTIPHPFAALSGDGRYLAVIDERNLASEPEEADVDLVVLH